MRLIVIPAFLLGFLSLCESNVLPDYCRPGSKCYSNKRGPQVTVKKIGDRLLDVECLAGSDWMSHCYKCTCSGSGLAQCRLESTDCVGTDGRTLDPIRCKPGSSFNRSCNTCTCEENGLSKCTIDECGEINPEVAIASTSAAPTINKPELVLVSQKEEVGIPPAVCAAGTSWLSQCNRCTCSQDGQPTCEKNPCKGSTEPIRLCKPKSTWEDRSSQCWCDDAGQPFCTRDSFQIVDNINFGDEESTEKETPKPNIQNRGSNVKPNEDQTRGQTDRARSRGQKTNTPLKNPGGVTTNSDGLQSRESFNHNRRSNQRQPSRNYRKDSSVKFGDGEEKLGSSYVSSTTEDISDIDHNIVRRSVCKPNQNFKQDCNICACGSDGLSFKCTQNECMEKGEVDKEVEVFMETEGIDHIERHSVCRALGVFYIGCNTCLCNFDGTDYTCTNKPCPLPEDVELFHELRERRSSANNTSKPKIVCVANRMFIKDCNTCWCNEDGTSYTCTRKVCVQDLPDDADVDDESTQDLRIIKESCRPDEVFESDCNLCFCNKDGNSYSCTKKACLTEITEAAEVHHVDGQDGFKNGPKIHPIETDLDPKASFSQRRYRRAATQPEPPKSCKPDSEFRLDCNTCLCDNMGKNFSCTRNDCSKPNGVNPTPRKEERKKREIKEQEATCTPGSVFEQGCSVCRCDSDGKHATCNVRVCIVKNDDKQEPDNTNAVTSESNFRCNPGEQFKRECNDCTCSADGKSVFCTLRFCDVVESSGNV